MITSQMRIRSSSWSICTLPTVCNRLSKPVFSLLPFFDWLPASFKYPPAASSDTDCSGYVLLPSLWFCLNFLPKSLLNFLSNTYLFQLSFLYRLILELMCSRLLYEISPYRCRCLPFASLLLFYRFSWLPIYMTLVYLYFSVYSILENPEIPIGSWMKGASTKQPRLLAIWFKRILLTLKFIHWIWSFTWSPKFTVLVIRLLYSFSCVVDIS